MRCVLFACSVLSAAVVGACGGGHEQAGQIRAPAPPVAQQVRSALLDALRGPVPGQALAAGHARLPFVAVSACTGPPGGAVGTYHCATTPRGPRGVRAVTVDVEAGGTWSTRPVSVQTTLDGHRSSAVAAVWGVGLRLPR